jgi:hypothetical protein
VLARNDDRVAGIGTPFKKIRSQLNVSGFYYQYQVIPSLILKSVIPYFTRISFLTDLTPFTSLATFVALLT